MKGTGLIRKYNIEKISLYETVQGFNKSIIKVATFVYIGTMKDYYCSNKTLRALCNKLNSLLRQKMSL